VGVRWPVFYAFIIAFIWFALSAWVAVIFIQLTIGIWFPQHASEKQLQLVQNPAISLMYPALKWLSPVIAVTLPIQIIVGVFHLAKFIAEISAT